MCIAFFLVPFLLGANIPLEIGGHSLVVELADNPETRQTGLMNRDHLEEGTGMLFVFDEAQILAFWMKNTCIPLSIGFFDAEKKLINIADMSPSSLDSPPTYLSQAPSKYALEVPQGWFEKHRIRPGMKFSFHDRQDRVK